MTADHTPDVIESRLRAALGDLRPSAEAPEDLRSRVGALPEQIGNRSIIDRIAAARRPLLATAAFVAIASIAALAISFTPLGRLPPGTNAPDSTGFDPTVEGPGLLLDPVPTLLIVQIVATVAAVVFGVRFGTGKGFRSRRGRAFGLVVVAVAGTSIMFAVQSQFSLTGASGTALGYDANVVPPPGANGPRVYYSTAEPGKPTIAFFEFWNFGALPVRLEGLVTDMNPDSLGSQWVALALPTVANEFPNSLDKLQSFTPQLIPPQSSVTIYLVGRAGECAFGPGYQPGVSDATSFSSFPRDVRLGYSIFGLSSTTVVEMPMQLVEPAAVHCP